MASSELASRKVARVKRRRSIGNLEGKCHRRWLRVTCDARSYDAIDAIV